MKLMEGVDVTAQIAQKLGLFQDMTKETFMIKNPRSKTIFEVIKLQGKLF